MTDCKYSATAKSILDKDLINLLSSINHWVPASGARTILIERLQNTCNALSGLIPVSHTCSIEQPESEMPATVLPVDILPLPVIDNSSVYRHEASEDGGIS